MVVRIAVVVVALLLSTTFARAAQPKMAYVHGSAVPVSCMGDDAYNAVAASELIVAGRVQAWRPIGSPRSTTHLVPIQLTLAVDQVFKGQAKGAVPFIDTASLKQDRRHGQFWVGRHETCGSFDADPRGAYVIVGLLRWRDGTYRSQLLRTFFVGTDPRGAEYMQALHRLATLGPDQLPNTGAVQVEEMAVLGISGVLMLTGYVLQRRSRRTKSTPGVGP